MWAESSTTLEIPNRVGFVGTVSSATFVLTKGPGHHVCSWTCSSLLRWAIFCPSTFPLPRGMWFSFYMCITWSLGSSYYKNLWICPQHCMSSVLIHTLHLMGLTRIIFFFLTFFFLHSWQRLIFNQHVVFAINFLVFSLKRIHAIGWSSMWNLKIHLLLPVYLVTGHLESFEMSVFCENSQENLTSPT